MPTTSSIFIVNHYLAVDELYKVSSYYVYSNKYDELLKLNFEITN